MKLNIYSVYDVATQAYKTPWFSQADGEAMRGFKDVCSDAEHPMGQHPEDYTLFRMGTFNDNTGKIEGEVPEKLLTGLQVVAANRQIAPGSLKDEESEQ